MSQKRYRIRPLVWVRHDPHRDDPPGTESWSTDTVFGSMSAECLPGQTPRLRWRYCFDEYYDEGTHDCESIEDGKRRAEAFYLERLLPALEATP